MMPIGQDCRGRGRGGTDVWGDRNLGGKGLGDEDLGGPLMHPERAGPM